MATTPFPVCLVELLSLRTTQQQHASAEDVACCIHSAGTLSRHAGAAGHATDLRLLYALAHCESVGSNWTRPQERAQSATFWALLGYSLCMTGQKEHKVSYVDVYCGCYLAHLISPQNSLLRSSHSHNCNCFAGPTRHLAIVE